MAQSSVELIKVALASNQPIFIKGKRGQGKSETIKAVCKEEGYTCITRNLNGAESYEVVAGLPRQNGEAFNYLIPMWWKDVESQLKAGQKICLFFDEINHAMPEVLNGLHGVLDPERRIAGLELPEVRIIAAGNMAEENETLTDLPLPLLDRFAIIVDDFQNPGAEDYLVAKYPEMAGITKMIFATKDKNPRMVEKLLKCLKVGLVDKNQILRLISDDKELLEPLLQEIKKGNFGFDLKNESKQKAKRKKIADQLATLDDEDMRKLINEL